MGHTHEDIDQIFSVVSKAMLSKDKHVVEILTPCQFDSFLETKVFPSKCRVVRMFEMFDIQRYLEAHINPNLRGLGHSSWNGKNPVHCLRLTWQEEMVILQYKYNENDEFWRPVVSPGS